MRVVLCVCFQNSTLRPDMLVSILFVVSSQGDPIRALGESISFGRFIPESLAWEKWSAFSHNRYVEEAKKFFRRKAVEKAAAAEKASTLMQEANSSSALIQEGNSSSSRTSNAETQDENHTNSSIEIKSKSDGNLAIIEQMDQDAKSVEVPENIAVPKEERMPDQVFFFFLFVCLFISDFFLFLLLIKL